MKHTLIVGLMLFLLYVSVSCAQETPPAGPLPQTPPAAPAPAPTPVPLPPPAPLPPGPGTPGAANDDIVSAPGGFTYRASIHQQGQPDWPPVQGSETALSTPLGYIGIGYRSYIETLAGETRNNVIYLDANNAPEIADPIQVDYHPVGLPDGITLVRGMQGYGGIGGQDRKSSRVVLVTQIAPTVKPGDYPFLIQLEYEGEIFGSLPVTVRVK